MSLSKKPRRAFEKMAQQQGLRMDPLSEHVYGVKNGYHIAVQADRLEQKKTLVLFFAAVTQSGPITEPAVRQAAAPYPILSGIAVRGNCIAFAFTGKNPDQCIGRTEQAITAATNVLHSIGGIDCCHNCGAITPTATASVNGVPEHLCQKCYEYLCATTPVPEQAPARKQNVLGGIIGAFLGSLAGVAAIILFSQLGIVSALSGLLMAFCTLWMYEKMAGGMSRGGIVVCIAVMLLMVYVGDRADWAIIAVRDLEVDFITGFRIIPNLLKEEMIDGDAYAAGLMQIYLFALLGAIPMIRANMQNRKTELQREKLRETPVYLMR